MCLAVPGRVLEITEGDSFLRMARVCFGGITKEVCLAYTPEARVGDYVIVHVGVAISLLDEAEADRVFEFLAQMGDLAILDDGDYLRSRQI